MNSKELLESLREAARGEEGATAMYLNHISAITHRSGLEKEDAETARAIIDHLIGENEVHRRTILDIIEKMEGRRADDI